jgi:hypothetical protein
LPETSEPVCAQVPFFDARILRHSRVGSSRFRCDAASRIHDGLRRGRPKWFADPDLSELFKKILAELISVNEDGRRKKITKLEALVKQVIHTAISKGSRREVEFVLSMISREDGPQKTFIQMLREWAERGRELQRRETERQAARALTSIPKR